MVSETDKKRQARKALLLAVGPAGDAARAMKKRHNAKSNPKNNPKNIAKVKERGRVNAEMRMRANPSMAVQIQTVQEISNQLSSWHEVTSLLD